MSYDISLRNPDGTAIELDEAHMVAGGTYALGGTQEPWLNITYNYSKHFHRVLEGGIRSIYGKTAAETIPILIAAASKLESEWPPNPDYWGRNRG